MTATNLQTEWASLLFETLADVGVTDVVISPGSRSTPFVAAAVREHRLRRHTVIDERAAAFFALGQARVTGTPSALLCTSGTAAAHYLPAIIEANVTGTPMLVITADRPPELYECRAPQTIDQVKMFGGHARWFFDLVPDESESALRALRRVVAQGVLTAKWPQPGAVHLNARAYKPLEPIEPISPEEHALAKRVRAIAAAGAPFAAAPRVIPSAESIAAAAAMIRGARRGVIVAGPAQLSQRRAREAFWDLANATGFPVFAEATSQLRFGPKPQRAQLVDGFELLLRSEAFRRELEPDLVLQMGAPPTSGPWGEIASAVPHVVMGAHGWSDPHGSARVMVLGSEEEGARELASALRAYGPPSTSPLRASLKAANEAAWGALERELASDDEPLFTEAVATMTLVDAAMDDSLVVVGNSLAVRILETYARPGERELGILSQRGASGIDGLVAGAVGAATSSGKPTALLLGDVSLLHDLTSLALASRVRTPLVVLVLHNGGGRIFEQLPLASRSDLDPEVLRHASTPHDTDFSHAAALFGLAYARVATHDQLRDALATAYARTGATLVEARVPASGAVELGRRLTTRIDAALSSLTL